MALNSRSHPSNQQNTYIFVFYTLYLNINSRHFRFLGEGSEMRGLKFCLVQKQNRYNSWTVEELIHLIYLTMLIPSDQKLQWHVKTTTQRLIIIIKKQLKNYIQLLVTIIHGFTIPWSFHPPRPATKKACIPCHGPIQ